MSELLNNDHVNNYYNYSIITNPTRTVISNSANMLCIGNTCLDENDLINIKNYIKDDNIIENFGLTTSSQNVIVSSSGGVG